MEIHSEVRGLKTPNVKKEIEICFWKSFYIYRKPKPELELGLVIYTQHIYPVPVKPRVLARGAGFTDNEIMSSDTNFFVTPIFFEDVRLEQVRAILHEYLGIIYYWVEGHV